MGDQQWPPIEMSDNFASSDFYKDGVRADAEFSVAKAAEFTRNMLRDDDDMPDDLPVLPKPWTRHVSKNERPGEYYYTNPVTRKTTFRHPGVSGTPGRVPALDLLRIWDTGASQGMTDRAQVSSDAAFSGDRIVIHTGNGQVSSTQYERVTVAPGISQVHVALPATANTVSPAGINVECKVGFQWL